MSDDRSPDTPESPPPPSADRREGAPWAAPLDGALREVDWLAVAPWLLVLRSVGVTLGWPLVIGAVGMSTLGGGGEAGLGFSPSGWPAAIASAPERLAAGPDARFFATAARVLGWLALGVGIVGAVERRLTGASPGASDRSPLEWLTGVWLGGLKRLGGVVLLLVTFLAAPAGGLAAFYAWLPLATQAWLTPVVQGLVGLPLTVALVVAVLGAPLAVAATVIDRADPFDAVSRTFAYTLQRPGTLAACVMLAWAGGAIAGGVLEWLLAMTASVVNAFAAGPPDATPEVGTQGPFFRAVRGFYPAYLFSAAAATYLVMRFAVDGQPIDELAEDLAPALTAEEAAAPPPPNDQPA